LTSKIDKRDKIVFIKELIEKVFYYDFRL